MGKRGKKVSVKTKKEVLKLSKQYGVNYLVSHFNLSKSEIYTILRQERKKPAHFTELSITALKLADILGKHHEHPVTVIPFRTRNFPYKGLQYEILPCGGQLVELAELDREKVSNLVCHLKAEIPELVSIIKYPEAFREWFALPDDEKLSTKPPEITITDDLILKLKLKANQGDFSGKCPACPR